MSVKGSSKSRQLTDDEESEGLALLIPDIQETARIVSVAVHRILDKSSKLFSFSAGLAVSSFNIDLVNVMRVINEALAASVFVCA